MRYRVPGSSPSRTPGTRRSSRTPRRGSPRSRDSSARCPPPRGSAVEAHGGRLAVEVLRRYGVDTMFTLSGGHLFVLYDGAVQSGDMRLIDARHEQTVED